MFKIFKISITVLVTLWSSYGLCAEADSGSSFSESCRAALTIKFQAVVKEIALNGKSAQIKDGAEIGVHAIWVRHQKTALVTADIEAVDGSGVNKTLLVKMVANETHYYNPIPDFNCHIGRDIDIQQIETSEAVQKINETVRLHPRGAYLIDTNIKYADLLIISTCTITIVENKIDEDSSGAFKGLFNSCLDSIDLAINSGFVASKVFNSACSEKLLVSKRSNSVDIYETCIGDAKRALDQHGLSGAEVYKSILKDVAKEARE